MGLKARVKATGEIVEIILKQVDPIQQKYVNCETGVSYYREELVFDVNQKCFPYDEDYWTRLEHQYAGMAMHALTENGIRAKNHEIAGMAAEIAHALVEELKSNN